jgi:hypothetical protein
LRNSTIAFLCLLVFALPCRAQTHDQLSEAEQQLLRDMLKLPPGTKIERETVRREREAGGKGAGGTSSGTEAKLDVDSSAPKASLAGEEGGSAEGGDANANAWAESIMPKSPWANPMLWFGVILGVAGALCYAVPFPFPLPVPQRKIGAALVGVGVTLVAIAFFPWILIPAVIGIVAILLWPWMHAEWTKAKAKRDAETQRAALQDEANAAAEREKLARAAIDTMASGIEDLDEAERLNVKDKISRHATEAETVLIREVKREVGLPSERPGAGRLVAAPVPTAPVQVS